MKDPAKFSAGFFHRCRMACGYERWNGGECTSSLVGGTRRKFCRYRISTTWREKMKEKSCSLSSQTILSRDAKIGCRGENTSDEFPHLIPRLSLSLSLSLFRICFFSNGGCVWLKLFFLHKIVIKRDSQRVPGFFFIVLWPAYIIQKMGVLQEF